MVAVAQRETERVLVLVEVERGVAELLGVAGRQDTQADGEFVIILGGGRLLG